MVDDNEVVELSLQEIVIEATSEDGYSPLTIKTSRGDIACRYYKALNASSAVIWVGGIGGGFDTPAQYLYPDVSLHLTKKGISAFQVQYRFPSNLHESVLDVLSGVHFLEHDGINRFGLVGHSFGGAVVIQAGVVTEPVKTVVTLATQASGATESVANLPKDCSLLVIHGKRDKVLPYTCSQQVFAKAHEPKELVLYDAAGHSLDEFAQQVHQKVTTWLKDALD